MSQASFERIPSISHDSPSSFLLIFLVVAGIRTPEPISRMAQELPEAYNQFISYIQLLEKHFKDMQDVEFTVEDGKLWMLQCRLVVCPFVLKSKV